jgi:hypothetical protein
MKIKTQPKTLHIHIIKINSKQKQQQQQRFLRIPPVVVRAAFISRKGGVLCSTD